nr:protein translocase subunit SECA2, chloroplastic [Ipomoea trifida]
MEYPEPPECPVCLQPYDSVATIPRVLACGHSACEPCLAQLPNAFPDTIRCPACTQLPWLLPENSVSTEPRNSGTKSPDDFCYLLYGCFRNHDSRSNRCSVEKEEVCLVKVGTFIDKNESCYKFKYSYEVKVMRVLYGMAEGRFQGSLSMLTDLIAGENGEEKVRCMTSWAMVGLGICEAVYNLHLQGLSIGCLGASCFGLDEFGHAYVDICETLIAGRRVGKMIAGKEDQNLSASLENENTVSKKESMPHCLLFGDLCLSIWRTNKQSMGENQRKDAEEVEISKIDKDVVEGIPDGQVKCIDLKEHRDCITGFAIGGGFLFSSSFDKVVNVWSLQDYSHVHAFKGHEQRVTAVAFVDDKKPLCISGDNGGVICIWGASVPLGPEPIKKIYEQKDWRYSGIHALVDYELSCTMNGHKSVVSSLAVCNEVLYSGSWDGTVRLWCLSDHSPLAVLGESTPGNMTSVLSIAADEHTLVAAHENGIIKIWFNDTLLKSTQAHNGAVFSACKKGRWIFTGGWDKTVSVQELSEEDTQTDATAFGSIPCDSVVTALLYWQGKLFIGQADRVIKVYYFSER